MAAASASVWRFSAQASDTDWRQALTGRTSLGTGGTLAKLGVGSGARSAAATSAATAEF